MRKILLLVLVGCLVGGCSPVLQRAGHTFNYTDSKGVFSVRVDPTYSFIGDGTVNMWGRKVETYAFEESKGKNILIMGVKEHLSADPSSYQIIISKRCLNIETQGSCFTAYEPKTCSFVRTVRYYPADDITVGTSVVKELGYTETHCADWLNPVDSFTTKQKDFLDKFERESEKLLTVEHVDKK